jgi:hypothetical protein
MKYFRTSTCNKKKIMYFLNQMLRIFVKNKNVTYNEKIKETENS